MGRVGARLVLTLIAGACAASTAFVYRPAQRALLEAPGAAAVWARWNALSDAERLACIQRYQAVARRPEAAEVFRRVRRFAALPVAERERLRSLYALLQEVIGNLPASGRASLRPQHERARAEAVYRLLAAESPQRIAELRERFAGRP